jgi:hypothetical protein
MNKEMRDLKKYHLEEVQKLEGQHSLKYKQLKQMMDEYRLQIQTVSKLSKSNQDYISGSQQYQ